MLCDRLGISCRNMCRRHGENSRVRRNCFFLARRVAKYEIWIKRERPIPTYLFGERVTSELIHQRTLFLALCSVITELPMAVEATRQTHPSDEIWVSVGFYSKQNTNAYAYGQGRQVLQRFPRLRDAISESVNPKHGTSGAILTQTSPPSPPAMNENRSKDRTKDAKSDKH